MKIVLVAGSHRNEAESERVAKYAAAVLEQHCRVQSHLISLARNPLPLWDEEVWQGSDRWRKLWEPISNELKAADGVVIVSPEWSGMVPPGLKNFFLLCGTAELAHKPGLIVTVSAGMGGAYPVNELRISSYKNTRICYLPEHVIVRNVGDMLQGEAPASEQDAALRSRLAYALHLLVEYAAALKPVRESNVIDHRSFPHGM